MIISGETEISYVCAPKDTLKGYKDCMILFYREVDLVSSIFNIEELLESDKTMVQYILSFFAFITKYLYLKPITMIYLWLIYLSYNSAD